jgi:hypothetical protein
VNYPTPDDAMEFERYVKKWQVRLGLQDWRIVMSPKPAKGSLAEMANWDWRQRQVTCRLGPDWKSTPVNSTTLEQTAVHELLHVLLYELIEYAKETRSSPDDLASVEHRVVNTLESILVPGGE